MELVVHDQSQEGRAMIVTKPLELAFVGAGNVGGLHAKASDQIEGARLVAVADVIEERAKALAEPAGAGWYSSYAQMLKQDNIDAVDICTASGMHGEIAVAVG